MPPDFFNEINALARALLPRVARWVLRHPFCSVPKRKLTFKVCRGHNKGICVIRLSEGGVAEGVQVYVCAADDARGGVCS
ncbi:hypothetical protein FQZ97_1039360 [compost metagenome]